MGGRGEKKGGKGKGKVGMGTDCTGGGGVIVIRLSFSFSFSHTRLCSALPANALSLFLSGWPSLCLTLTSWLSCALSRAVSVLFVEVLVVGVVVPCWDVRLG